MTVRTDPDDCEWHMVVSGHGLRENAASQSYEAYEPNAPPPFNDFTTMNRGEGYWIVAKESCMLTYP